MNNALQQNGNLRSGVPEQDRRVKLVKADFCALIIILIL